MSESLRGKSAWENLWEGKEGISFRIFRPLQEQLDTMPNRHGPSSSFSTSQQQSGQCHQDLQHPSSQCNQCSRVHITATWAAVIEKKQTLLIGYLSPELCCSIPICGQIICWSQRHSVPKAVGRPWERHNYCSCSSSIPI